MMDAISYKYWFASFQILSSSFTYDPFVRRCIVLVSERASVNKLQILMMIIIIIIIIMVTIMIIHTVCTHNFVQVVCLMERL
jgi:hypothetical protein